MPPDQAPDTQLHVVWNETLGEIHVQLMGEIQLEVLRSLLAERFGLEVEFGSGGILYKETITEPMAASGHRQVYPVSPGCPDNHPIFGHMAGNLLV